MADPSHRDITHEAWLAEARELFGDDPLTWAFKCPVCKHVATVKDWKDAGAPEGGIAFSCVGRYLGAKEAFTNKPGPCNYTGGGLFRLNPVHVRFGENSERETFEFAPPEKLSLRRGDERRSDLPEIPSRLQRRDAGLLPAHCG